MAGEDEMEMEGTPYPFLQLEDDLIKYICEKIVSMREQPFIDAVDNLKKAQELSNLQIILEMQKNKARAFVGQNAAPMSNLTQVHKQMFNDV